MKTNDAFLASYQDSQRSKTMNVIISEYDGAINDLYRFCATVEGDKETERAGFGATEDCALADLAHQYGHTTTDFLQRTIVIERVLVR